MSFLSILLWIVAFLWLIINITVLCVTLDSGSKDDFRINRDIDIGTIFGYLLILPLTVICLNLIRANPCRCAFDSFLRVLEYQPFKKKK